MANNKRNLKARGKLKMIRRFKFRSSLLMEIMEVKKQFYNFRSLDVNIAPRNALVGSNSLPVPNLLTVLLPALLLKQELREVP